MSSALAQTPPNDLTGDHAICNNLPDLSHRLNIRGRGKPAPISQFPSRVRRHRARPHRINGPFTVKIKVQRSGWSGQDSGQLDNAMFLDVIGSRWSLQHHAHPGKSGLLGVAHVRAKSARLGSRVARARGFDEADIVNEFEAKPRRRRRSRLDAVPGACREPASNLPAAAGNLPGASLIPAAIAHSPACDLPGACPAPAQTCPGPPERRLAPPRRPR